MVIPLQLDPSTFYIVIIVIVIIFFVTVITTNTVHKIGLDIETLTRCINIIMYYIIRVEFERSFASSRATYRSAK